MSKVSLLVPHSMQIGKKPQSAMVVIIVLMLCGDGSW